MLFKQPSFLSLSLARPLRFFGNHNISSFLFTDTHMKKRAQHHCFTHSHPRSKKEKIIKKPQTYAHPPPPINHRSQLAKNEYIYTYIYIGMYHIIIVYMSRCQLVKLVLFLSERKESRVRIPQRMISMYRYQTGCYLACAHFSVSVCGFFFVFLAFSLSLSFCVCVFF